MILREIKTDYPPQRPKCITEGHIPGALALGRYDYMNNLGMEKKEVVNEGVSP